MSLDVSVGRLPTLERRLAGRDGVMARTKRRPRGRRAVSQRAQTLRRHRIVVQVYSAGV